MDKSDFAASDGSVQNGMHRHYADSVQYLLKTEQQILRLISARAPVAKILDEICHALDCQIGNILSVVSLPDADSLGAAEIAQNAALFGLYAFFSAGIAADSGQRLGTLDMYSCLPRRPSFCELQFGWAGSLSGSDCGRMPQRGSGSRPLSRSSGSSNAPFCAAAAGCSKLIVMHGNTR